MKKTNRRLIILILISSLLLCIGYAEITDTELNITGTVESIPQTEVFITDVVTSNATSIINGYIGTVLDTKTVLGTASTSTVSYDISLYNNTEKNYTFIEVLKQDELYSNENIEYILTGLKEYETTIAPKASLSFTITFKYKSGASTANNVLESKLNFRFRELPRLSLSNEGEEYTLENIYPGYTAKEYEFTVTNKEENKINNVEMKYNFETTIDSPLTAKIYDASGKEVTGSITINGQGQTEINNKYTLKIIWDENANSTEYANKEYTCNIKLKAVPTNTDYAEYNITKEFNIDIKTAPFYLNTTLNTTNVQLTNNEESVVLTINNYNSTSAYNKYETKYEISLKDTNKYTITVTDTNSGKIASGANTNSVTVKFVPVTGVTLNSEEQVTLIVEATSPYAYTKEFTITIKNKNPVKTVTITSQTGKNTLGEKGTLQLTAKVLPEDATNKEVTWTSLNTDIATVNSTGLVTGIAKGTTTITATADGVSTTYEITVVDAITELITSGEAVKNNTTLVDKNGHSITIPANFNIASESPTEVTKGMIIEDSEDNQYVWIPVFTNKQYSWGADYSAVTSETDYTAIETALKNYTSSFKDSSYTDVWYGDASYGKRYYTDSKGNTVYYSNGNMTETQYKTLYNNMLKSVYENGGFYIGRYEMGIAVVNSTTEAQDITRTKMVEYTVTSTDDNNTAPSIGNMTAPISKANAVGYNYITQSQAQMLAEKLGKKADYSNVTSSIMFGVQWDAVCVFIFRFDTNNTASVKMFWVNMYDYSKYWGNYTKASFKLNQGYYTTKYSSTTVTWNQDYTTAKGTSTNWLCTTGASKQNSSLNIYDFAGNLAEWTLERSSGSSNPCVLRGGVFNGSTYASYRLPYYFTAALRYTDSSRSSLFIK